MQLAAIISIPIEAFAVAIAKRNAEVGGQAWNPGDS
jgi:hypothetical protein